MVLTSVGAVDDFAVHWGQKNIGKDQTYYECDVMVGCHCIVLYGAMLVGFRANLSAPQQVK